MGPLDGIRVVEMAGIGPAPFCCMLLAQMGAEIVRIDRIEPSGLGVDIPARFDFLNRGKRTVALDLKAPGDVATALALIGKADVLIEGFRPGVMEKLGLGPQTCHDANPGLVYGRMTGWGQEGPLSQAAGHDINYIALTGALAAIGETDGPPVAPLNLVGDFGGGALYLAMGVLAALVERQRSGRGQIVDAAITDGTASLMTMMHSLAAMGVWQGRRGANLVDGGAPYYAVYETLDGKYVSIGAIEAKFYRDLIVRLGLVDAGLPEQNDRRRWPELRARFAETFRARTRDDWCALLEGTDVCFAPVLDMDEAPNHPHNAARGTYVDLDGLTATAAAPRFSRTPGAAGDPAQPPDRDVAAVLARWGASARG